MEIEERGSRRERTRKWEEESKRVGRMRLRRGEKQEREEAETENRRTCRVKKKKDKHELDGSILGRKLGGRWREGWAESEEEGETIKGESRDKMRDQEKWKSSEKRRERCSPHHLLLLFTLDVNTVWVQPQNENRLSAGTCGRVYAGSRLSRSLVRETLLLLIICGDAPGCIAEDLDD